MDTSRDYYEDRIADFNRYRQSRNLYHTITRTQIYLFLTGEGVDKDQD